MTNDEATQLMPRLRKIAHVFSRFFSGWRMDEEDFLQQLFLGALGVQPRKGESREDLLYRRIAAGRNRAIDAMRTFDTRYYRQGSRQMELLVEDINYLSEATQFSQSTEDLFYVRHDLQVAIGCLPLRKQQIILSLLNGDTLLEIANARGVTEGRVQQLKKETIQQLKEELCRG